MLKKSPIYILILAQALWGSASPVFAKDADYIEGTVSDAGSLTGKIRFQGPVPPPAKVDLTVEKNSEFCLENAAANDKGELLIQHVEVDGGYLKDAVIFIQDIKKGKPWPKQTLNIDFKNCQASPKVSVARRPLKFENDGLLVIRNHDDGVLHNPKGYSIRNNFRKKLFKKFLLSKGSEMDVTKVLKHLRKKRDSHLYVECEQHLWMTVSSKIAWNPYYDISRDDGAFKIGQIPPGTYKVTVWHPYVGKKTAEATIAKGSNTGLDFSFP